MVKDERSALAGERGLPAEIGEDGVHVFRVRVYFEDTDATGIVYNANYLRFAERGRTELMRALGLEHTTMIECEARALAVRRCTADFLKPAVLDDLLEVNTRVVRVRGASVDLEQDVKRGGDDLVRLGFTIACITTADRRVARIPGDVRTRLEELCQRNRQAE